MSKRTSFIANGRNKWMLLICVLVGIAALGWGNFHTLCFAQEDAPGTESVKDPAPTEKSGTTISVNEQLSLLWEQFVSFKRTVEMAELRSYQNKMMVRELIRWVRAGVVILIIIAAGFPLTVYLMSRKRILGLSKLSSEMSATLVSVEERQNKLANVLKEIQGEMDYLNSMSVPDLERLIKQAEAYLAQNEQELRDAGLSGKNPSKGASDST